MRELAGFVRELAGRPEVDAVVLASPDGLPIDQAGLGDLDAEELAALAATCARGAVQLAAAGGRGAVRTAVIETDQGLVVVAGAGAEGWLLVLTRRGVNIGELLFDLRRRRPALTALL
jgi:predicted regulator of Ras-like GTPase activity (Roadblock/LC7/MglB family)